MSDDRLDASIGHSRLMDDVYRHQRHIYDATRKYYLLGRDRLIAGLDLGPGSSLLEIGCGTGRNLAAVAAAHPGARLFGLDISSEMLATARDTLRRKGVADAELRRLDATRFEPADFDATGFDRVMISYALSMIPDWQGAVKAALAALNPGGSLHIVDFGTQSQLPGWSRALLRAWLIRFHVTPRDGLEPFLMELARDNGLDLQFHQHARSYATIAILRRTG